jgi:23S rRNA (cytidine1920-2'-O)/16S rRNA (cytidine1409-2'-O)-methyltransferase
VGRFAQELKKGSRLDTLLVERGLVATRERARALVLAGQVRVNGQPATKAGHTVQPEDEVTLDTPDHPYVGRGGVKLAHALDVFGITPAGRMALDIGASTGGFTDVLLQRGATRVVAVDVGHGQLDWKLRSDPRVVVMERHNARTLTPQQLPEDAQRFHLITIDVSFISLRQILPVLPPLLQPGGDVVALVKPQFEVGRAGVGKGGVVRDEAARGRAIERVLEQAAELGFERRGQADSVLRGPEGNLEHFVWLRARLE